MKPLSSEVDPMVESIFQRKCKKVSEAYDRKAFGNAYVAYLLNNVKFVILRDRGELSINIGSATNNPSYYFETLMEYLQIGCADLTTDLDGIEKN
jgi:hypothetical protein